MAAPVKMAMSFLTLLPPAKCLLFEDWHSLGPARRVGSSHLVMMGSVPMRVGTRSATELCDHTWQPQEVAAQA
eukprot:16002242-Heterocapsa_arctica.AAC.1